LLNLAAHGYWRSGADRERARELWRQVAPLIEGLSYEDELSPIYINLFAQYIDSKEPDRALRLLGELERQMARRADPRDAGLIHSRMEYLLASQGDLRGALAHMDQALASAQQASNVVDQTFYTLKRGERSLHLGDLERAESDLHRALATYTRMDNPRGAWASWRLAVTHLCQGRPRSQVRMEVQAAHDWTQRVGLYPLELWTSLGLGWLALGEADRPGALHHFRDAAALATVDRLEGWLPRMARHPAIILLDLLCGLEEAMADREAYRTLCDAFPGRERFADGAAYSPDLAGFALTEWALDRAVPADAVRSLCEEGFDHPLPLAWEWVDPLGDCGYQVQNGLALRAANGRDLWQINWSAPRLLRPLPEGAAGEPGIAVEALCTPLSTELAAMGGLLLWVDRENYMRVDWGSGGPYEVRFVGCVENLDLVVGRGRLPPEPVAGMDWDAPLDRVHLRLEWRAGQVRALCSADGEGWYTVGSHAFFFDPRAQIGVYAVADAERWPDPGAYPEGTAIRFQSFRCWEISG
jgi:tetratricopeptide (TPR) repeat protein